MAATRTGCRVPDRFETTVVAALHRPVRAARVLTRRRASVGWEEPRGGSPMTESTPELSVSSNPCARLWRPTRPDPRPAGRAGLPAGRAVRPALVGRAIEAEPGSLRPIRAHRARRVPGRGPGRDLPGGPRPRRPDADPAVPSTIPLAGAAGVAAIAEDLNQAAATAAGYGSGSATTTTTSSWSRGSRTARPRGPGRPAVARGRSRGRHLLGVRRWRGRPGLARPARRPRRGPARQGRRRD